MPYKPSAVYGIDSDQVSDRPPPADSAPPPDLITSSGGGGVYLTGDRHDARRQLSERERLLEARRVVMACAIYRRRLPRLDEAMLRMHP